MSQFIKWLCITYLTVIMISLWCLKKLKSRVIVKNNGHLRPYDIYTLTWAGIYKVNELVINKKIILFGITVNELIYLGSVHLMLCTPPLKDLHLHSFLQKRNVGLITWTLIKNLRLTATKLTRDSTKIHLLCFN